MTKHRFLIGEDSIHKDKVYIMHPDDIRKIRHVLRLKKGDNITVFDGEGTEYEAIIEVPSREKIIARIVSENKEEETGKPKIVLAQALTRGQKIDEIVRMNTEIGVEEFLFYEADHGIVKLKDFNVNKFDRWIKISEEASRQAERLTVPKFYDPMRFDEMLQTTADVKLLLHSRVDKKSIDIYKAKEQVKKGERIMVVIGPEGGFSKMEVEVAVEMNFNLVHVDLPVLRTETAGIVVNSILLS